MFDLRIGQRGIGDIKLVTVAVWTTRSPETMSFHAGGSVDSDQPYEQTFTLDEVTTGGDETI